MRVSGPMGWPQVAAHSGRPAPVRARANAHERIRHFASLRAPFLAAWLGADKAAALAGLKHITNGGDN